MREQFNNMGLRKIHDYAIYKKIESDFMNQNEHAIAQLSLYFYTKLRPQFYAHK